MDGFKSVFDNCQIEFDKYVEKHGEISLFSSFRKHRNIYGFLHNGDTPPDIGAIRIAMMISPGMYNKFITQNKNKKYIGYGEDAPKYKFYDNLDSRHIMLNVVLWSTIRSSINTVVEIGGGFGNWRRLNPDIPHWTIVDLPYVAKLQDWYLAEHELRCERTVPSKIDLVIATHSLSEIDWTTFEEYYKTIVMRSKYLLYAYHKISSGKTLVDRKLEMIHANFDIVFSTPSEDNNCLNVVYIKK